MSAPTLPRSDFANLHNHSEGSFLDGQAKSRGIARRAKKLGQEAVAITDHGECNQHVEFQKACLAEGIHPLFGMEGYLVDSVERVRAEKDAKNSHITLIAKTDKGLRNLWAWATVASTELTYYKPLMDWKHAPQFAEDLYATDGCLLSYLASAIIDDNEERCHELLGHYLDVFGDNFRIELHTWQFEEATDETQRKLNADMTKVNQGKLALATQYGIPLIVVNDSHYAEPEDWEKHAMVWQMNTKDKGDQTEGRGKTAAHMMADDELIYWMLRHGIAENVTREAIKNTRAIAESCTAEIKPKLRMPRLTESEEHDTKLFIRRLEEGFQRKVIDRGKGDRAEQYLARMEYETDLIISKRFPGYFNYVAEYTQHAKSRMLVGPGRGSATGSLCSYLTDITEVDPLEHDLPFERFMTPGRKNFPDIDLDFPQTRRPEMKQYLVDRFGEGNVATIGTLTRLAPKGILDNLRKPLEIPWSDSEEIKAIFERTTVDVNTGKENIDELWQLMIDELLSIEVDKVGERLRAQMAKHPVLFQRMAEMVGMVRQSSSHASGIVISDEPLLGVLPLRKKKNTITTMFDMDEVEWMGFIKFDILGLRHLDTIDLCLRLIKARHGVDIDIYAIGKTELSEPEIWTAPHTGDTLGIFQMETGQGTRNTKRFLPTSWKDVTDLISVGRPGVIDAGLLDPYLDRRAGIAEPHFDHPLTEPILGHTHGILVYQEDILKIVQQLAGFTPDEADGVRSGVAKKKMDKLVAFKQQFVDGCLNNPEFVEQSETGEPEKDALKIWASIEASGRYAFSINHATAYALISSWEVWLRHHYYREFVAALMATDPERIPLYSRHARSRGLEVLPHHINESDVRFIPTDTGVRYGLADISGVGDSYVQPIIAARQLDGPFTSLENYLERVKTNRGATERLIRIGAFDPIEPDRSDTLARFYKHLIATSKVKKDRERMAEKLAEIPDYTDPAVLAAVEEELTGSFVTQDPMAPYLKMIEKVCVQHPAEVEQLTVGDIATVGGTLVRRKDIVTKKGDPMCFITIEWNFQEFEVTVFPRDFRTYKNLLVIGKPLACRVIRLEKGCCVNDVVRLDFID